MASPTRLPLDPNHHVVMGALANDGSGDILPVEINPATGQLQVNTGSGGSLPSSIVSGQQTVTTTATALPSSALSVGVILESLSTNTVSIFIGGAGVTTATGVELQVGAALSAAVANLNVLYVVCASGSPVISWLGS